MEYYTDIIFEVSRYRSEILKDIERNFEQIKENNKDIEAKKLLVTNIRKFSGVKKIVLSFKQDYFNVHMIPIYNQFLAADLLNTFKDYKPGENIRSLKIIEEPNTYIEKLYFVFGYDIVNRFSPRELTAILLHELGHGFTYTSNFPGIFLNILNKLTILSSGAAIVAKLLQLLTAPIYITTILIIMLLSRSINFIEHAGEYKADQFASKYGYSDEIIKVLHKIYNIEKDAESKSNWFMRMFSFISQLIIPSSHPSSHKRIKKANEQMLSEYKKLYPKLSTELNIILKDMKISV